jgi:hypothetical protein
LSKQISIAETRSNENFPSIHSSDTFPHSAGR